MGDLRGKCQLVVVQGRKRQGKVERKFSIAEVGVVKWSEDHWTVELECDILFIINAQGGRGGRTQ